VYKLISRSLAEFAIQNLLLKERKENLRKEGISFGNNFQGKTFTSIK
jgi:hypothetical protein